MFRLIIDVYEDIRQNLISEGLISKNKHDQKICQNFPGKNFSTCLMCGATLSCTTAVIERQNSFYWHLQIYRILSLANLFKSMWPLGAETQIMVLVQGWVCTSSFELYFYFFLKENKRGLRGWLCSPFPTCVAPPESWKYSSNVLPFSYWYFLPFCIT